MELKKTNRGFYIAQFKDRYDLDCSIQESSLATEAAIWLGVHEVDGKPARMHLTIGMVRELQPLLQTFVDTGCLHYVKDDAEEPFVLGKLACEQGLTRYESGIADNTPEHDQWLLGWLTAKNKWNIPGMPEIL